MTVPFIFANASGRVPASELDVNFAYVANNVSTANVVVFAAQPNITSVGNLTALVVNGSVTSTQYIGNGNALTNIPGGNVVGAVAYATTANSVAGGNVSGPVAYATTANSVAGANVFGAVGLANVANTANAVAGANVSGQVGNALIAGTVYTNAQPNITSVGTLSSLSVTGNVRAGAFYGVSISSDTANLLVSANVADPALNWTFINDYSATGVASLLGPVAGFNQRGEVLLPGRFSTGVVTFTGPDYAAFPDSLVLAAGANISIAQTPDGLGNAATYVTTFDTYGDWYMPGNVSAVGNVDGNYFSGNGRNLTGILATSSYNNANVTALLSNLGSNVISGTGNITTTANISGNYILGNGSQLTGLSAYGNANVVANLAALGSNPISTTGNVTGGNLLTGGTLSFTGGSRLRPLGANLDIFAGTGSYVNLITSDESSSMGVAGSGGYITTAGGTWSFGTTGNLTAPGNISAVGNVLGSNFNTAGLVTATGNATAGNILTGGLISATGNIETSANVLVSGYINATGNIDGGNIQAGNSVFATGNVRGGNISTVGLVTATGNVTAGNILTGGHVSATGNVRGGNITTSGNISANTISITGFAQLPQYSIANVAALSGDIGYVIALTDSNPIGTLAFWNGTGNVWCYIGNSTPV